MQGLLPCEITPTMASFICQANECYEGLLSLVSTSLLKVGYRPFDTSFDEVISP